MITFKITLKIIYMHFFQFYLHKISIFLPEIIKKILLQINILQVEKQNMRVYELA